MRLSLFGVGTWLFALVALAIAAILLLSFALNIAAEDLHARAWIVRGLQPDSPRTPISETLSAAMAVDLTSESDAQVLDVRSQDLDHRADRIRELAVAASVAGLVLALATARPEDRTRTTQSASTALANTRSNGTV
jgi:hypothetical protein